MLNHGTVSYRAIIEKMARDTSFSQYYEEECKEWLWEIISLLGVDSLLIRVEEDIELSDYRALLPTNMESILGVKNKDTNSPLIQDLGIYKKSLPVAGEVGDHSVNTRVISDGVSYTSVDGSIIPDLSTAMVDVIQPQVNTRSNFRYKIQGNYLFVDGLKNATLTISYNAFPVEDNAPVIKNDPTVIEMCSWYIASKIAMRLFIKGEISGSIKNEIDTQLYFYQRRCRLKAVTPNYEMMEAMKQRLGLVPDTGRHIRGFTNM